MDATAAAAARGLAAPRVRARDALLLAGLTGGFQGGMAAVGWLAGDALGAAFTRFDHWIAFGLLMILGVRTIIEGLRDTADGEEVADPAHAFALRTLLILAVATSIDALAAGVTVPLLAPPPAVTLALIGGVTFALVLPAVYLGRAVGARFGGGLELVGGVALCAIGVKILVEHLA